MGKPQISVSLSLSGLAFSSLAKAAVRVSVHTMALCSGSPLLTSQHTVVSRWLVMPTALMLPFEKPFCSKILMAPSMQFSTDLTISSGSCSCQLLVCQMLMLRGICLY